MIERNLARDPLYIQFLRHFNMDRDYFECHEVMEELWLEEGRDLLCQGLLQVAVALFHVRNDNVSGAIKMFGQAIDKLARYPDEMLDINLMKLVQDSREYVERLTTNQQSPFPFTDMTIEIIDPELEALVMTRISH